MPESSRRLEILRLFATLNKFQLIACILSCILGKLSQSIKRITEESDDLHFLSISVWIYIGKDKSER